METPKSEYPNLSSKESLTKRYKPIWRLLLISNLALGAYMFAKARKKNLSIEDRKPVKGGVEDGKNSVEDAKDSVEAILDPTITSIPDTPSPCPATQKVKETISEDQQRELFKWILEEKRKFKPKDPEEKKRIDEEKAILKQFIHAKSIPSL